MKKLSIVLFSMLFIAGACKKSDSTTPPATIDVTGNWAGTWTVPGVVPPTPLAFSIKSDGTITACTTAQCTLSSPGGTGTWSITNQLFNAPIKMTDGSTSTYTGTVSSDGKSITNGSFTAGTTVIVTGTFTLNKQ